MTGIDRAIQVLLKTGLALSSIAAIAASVRVIFGFVIGVDWFWGGPLAAYSGPLAFAGALRLHQLSQRKSRDTDGAPSA